MMRVRFAAAAAIAGVLLATPATATTIFFADFEDGLLPSAFTLDLNSTGSGTTGRVRVLGDPSLAPGGRFGLAFDDSTVSGSDTTNEANLLLDLSNRTQVLLSFDVRDVGDETDPLPASFTGSAGGDGVSFSVDGTTFFRLIGGTLALGNRPASLSFDLTAAAIANSVVLSDTTTIRFQQSDNFPIPTDGLIYDNIRVADVPLPATASLLLVALGAVALRKRSGSGSTSASVQS